MESLIVFLQCENRGLFFEQYFGPWPWKQGDVNYHARISFPHPRRETCDCSELEFENQAVGKIQNKKRILL